MKTTLKFTIISLLIGGLATSCSQERLETNPTSSMSGASLMNNANSALVPLNGIYRTFWVADNQETFGPMSFAFMDDMMAEDMVLGDGGSGWFEWDVLYKHKNYFTSKDERSYNLWNNYYTWISNANYIIAAEKTMEGSKKDVDYVIGQAYAIRAFSYFGLAQHFARTLVGHEEEPCVPIYTDPTTPQTKGQPRATNAKVYEQIDRDINKAVELLEGTTRKHISHINYATALGLKARIALVENKWEDARDAARDAIAASGAKVLHTADFAGVNDVNKANVMWGLQIKSDQKTGYASYFAHMDTLYFGKNAYKQISKVLYSKMNPTDERMSWWNPSPSSPYNVVDGSNNVISGYIQDKFHFLSAQDMTGDYILMRVEEMYLTAAEAECQLGNDGPAIQYLMGLMSVRDPQYTCAKTGNLLGRTSNEETGSLLEEIITQRRIELWGEIGRANDLKRLHQGFRRTAEQGWQEATYRLSNKPTDNPENYMWIFLIPQSEFDGNENMTLENDQNPLSDE